MLGLQKLARGLRKGGRYCLLSSLALGLASCGGNDMADLRAYVDEVRGRPKTGIDPLPGFAPVDTYRFSPEGLRDPFQPAEPPEEVELDDSGGDGIRPDINRPREDLESYSLDSLRMVGTVNANSVRWGLVKANDGTIHRVRVGNYVGRSYGKILRIMEDRIELMEIIPDTRPGKWRERPASLALSE